ncbi:MAG: aminotransferase class I/II-fold pyridoxal phosphate-dependent enzyme [Candidatus Lokiarchaeota archaeon]|nr:aminotransferase class I/II-fold pyridoxal phosphate-dependent enzyme [Candidatus Lokiarchaeota archaeon]
MKELSKKVIEAPKSKIRELFDLAAGRSDVISLGIGQPDFPTPEPAILGTIDALNRNITTYAPTRGVPELLKALESKVKKNNKIETHWNENIIACNGGSNAITLAFASLFNPGDELVLFSPNFVSYFYCGSFFGIKIVEIKRNEDLSPDIERLEKSITNKTKAILINSPNNPTGYALDLKQLEQIADIAVQYDLYLISDEVYENYVYNGLQHVSPASLNGMFERTVTLNAMSKLYSATGFRLGYVVAPSVIVDLMEKYLQYTVAGTNHAAQYGFIEALKMDNSFFNPILRSFNERRNFIYQKLQEIGFEVQKPLGAFYIMPSLKPFGTSGSEFSMNIMKNEGVAVVPGDIFGSYSNDRLRLSYATSMDKLEEAMIRMEKFVKKSY